MTPAGAPELPAPRCAPWHAPAAPSFSRDAIRQLDRLATEEFGIPSIVLMENAAIRIAEFGAGALEAAGTRAVVAFCGPGNNGGDGLAASRHLANAGVAVAVVLSGTAGAYRGDAGTNLAIAGRMGVPMFETDPRDPLRGAARAADSLGNTRPLVIDALLGTGLAGGAREPVRSLIVHINGLRRAGARVLSVDIPSGLDADTGSPAGGPGGVAVEADWTVTLVGPKRGFASPAAAPYVGRIHTADIGVPRALAERLGGRGA